MALTKQELDQWLTYEPETGVFRWVRNTGSIKAGAVAGGKNHHGYRRLCLKGKLHAEHRLAWLAVHGVWPSNEIDHINGVTDDNRIANLRDVPHAVNVQNIQVRRDNSVGLAGVRIEKYSGKYRALIRHDGVTFQLGVFDVAEDAHAAYLSAKKQLHIGFVPERANNHCDIFAPYGAKQKKRAQLTMEDAITIKRLLASGALQDEIARRFSIAQTTVSNIKTGKRWADASAGDRHVE